MQMVAELTHTQLAACSLRSHTACLKSGTFSDHIKLAASPLMVMEISLDYPPQETTKFAIQETTILTVTKPHNT